MDKLTRKPLFVQEIKICARFGKSTLASQESPLGAEPGDYGVKQRRRTACVVADAGRRKRGRHACHHLLTALGASVFGLTKIVATYDADGVLAPPMTPNDVSRPQRRQDDGQQNGEPPRQEEKAIYNAIARGHGVRTVKAMCHLVRPCDRTNPKVAFNSAPVQHHRSSGNQRKIGDRTDTPASMLPTTGWDL
jgi:hypothetical protein